MRALRAGLRRAPFYGAYKALGHYPDYWYWKLRGEPERTPHLIKQRTVREYARRYSLRTLVETGTYHGEMVAAVQREFDQIDTIEIDPELARRARRRFARLAHVHVHEGDSGKILPQLLASIGHASLFWLDAGYYGWEGRTGNTDRLSLEFAAILQHREDHVVLMDDAHGLTGQGGLLSVEDLALRIGREFQNRAVEVRYDILRIAPVDKA